MELQQLRYFMEVANTQHITKSAENLHIAQPALTQAIHRFETDIGVKLFEQKGRGIVLNEYGRHLQQTLAPILYRLEKIPEELRRMAMLDRDTIRINVLAASALVTEAILEYKKRSEVNFSVFQNGNGVSDIEITTKILYHVMPERRDFEFAIDEEIFLAVPKGKYVNTVFLKDLTNEGFICLQGSKQFRSICDKYCHHLGFKPDVIFESDNPTAVRNAIAAGMGVGFWPQFTWGTAKNENVDFVKLADFPFKRYIVISYNYSRADNNHIRGFFEYLKEFFLSRKFK